MRYEPHQDEIAAVPTMTDEELLEYFMYRIFETDEIWGLKEAGQWQTHQVLDQESMPVWPYKCYAEQAVNGEWLQSKPVAESVESFTYQTLNKLAQLGKVIEIMPRTSDPGCLISPQRLFSMLENTMEARESNVGD
ncbi:hypothetical protein A1359_18815 [Methylomonas lenta]|uniref:DUF2750 domain-containing protein n=2 Tax=Methylomonas lenta TaxID=980561 RepID=A0A177NXL8_9GAMM|nr:hypothetical protein A1359_18815 [Methylomonas lenta]